jgi:hypothetical protein
MADTETRSGRPKPNLRFIDVFENHNLVVRVRRDIFKHSLFGHDYHMIFFVESLPEYLHSLQTALRGKRCNRLHDYHFPLDSLANQNIGRHELERFWAVPIDNECLGLIRIFKPLRLQPIFDFFNYFVHGFLPSSVQIQAAFRPILGYIVLPGTDTW